MSRPINLLDPVELARINSSAAVWEAIEDYFGRDGVLCSECKYRYTYTQKHGPGMWESYDICDIIEGAVEDSLQPSECPALEDGKLELPEELLHDSA